MTEDVVTGAWLARHGILIPRAAGYYESDTAWVKVDNAGRICHAGLRDQTILSSLISREKLGEEAQYYGFTYLDWRAAYFARIECARHHSNREYDETDWSKEERFGLLLRQVERKHMRYVEIMMAGNPLQRDRIAAEESPDPFIASFQKLKAAIDSINEDAEDEAESRRNTKQNTCAINQHQVS